MADGRVIVNQLNEVEMRCERAVEELDAKLVDQVAGVDRIRLLGKVEGVKLALSYIEEARR